MAINSALIAGAQIFRSDDRPLYHRGRTINVGVLSLGVACACTLSILYRMSNRRIIKEIGPQNQLGSNGEAPAEDTIAIEQAASVRKRVYNL